MSENLVPEEFSSDVIEKNEAEEVKEASLNLADKTLAELSELFQGLKDGADSMLRSKEAESIKSAFYKLLLKLKSENGEQQENPFVAVEENFKALYADYKKERAEFNRQQEAQREENLVKKQAVIDELRSLIEGQDDVSASFNTFRELQNKWREAGPVPTSKFRDVNDTYQFLVEKFYDMVKINRDLRDLDFKKNLEAKLAFCDAAEKLSENENIVNAFHELQKLHEQWKEFGPVAKEYREDIWNRFKAATSVINKKYQAHFEELKESQTENLEGGQTMNPSAESFVKAFSKVNADRIFVFPNNSNVIMTAGQAASLYKDSKVYVIPTKTVGAGYAVFGSIDFSEQDSEAILSQAEEVIGSVTVAMVSRAVRDTDEVRKDDYMGFESNDILCSSSDRQKASEMLCEKLDAASFDVILIFKGKDVPAEEAEALRVSLESRYRRSEVIMIDGGQPVFDYIFIFE